MTRTRERSIPLPDRRLFINVVPSSPHPGFIFSYFIAHLVYTLCHFMEVSPQISAVSL